MKTLTVVAVMAAMFFVGSCTPASERSITVEYTDGTTREFKGSFKIHDNLLLKKGGLFGDIELCIPLFDVRVVTEN